MTNPTKTMVEIAAERMAKLRALRAAHRTSAPAASPLNATQRALDALEAGRTAAPSRDNTMLREAFDALKPRAALEFVQAGGKVVDAVPAPALRVETPGGKVMSRAEFDLMSPREGLQFVQAGGTVYD